MADLIYNTFPLYLGDGTIDLDSDTLKVSLHTSSYTPDAGHSSYTDLDNEVANGNGYTTGGETLGTVTWNEDSGTATLSAANPSWTTATFIARYAVVYDDTPAGKPLICLFDFSTDQSVSNGTFTLQFNASGILTIS
jgi:hypothetical protein